MMSYELCHQVNLIVAPLPSHLPTPPNTSSRRFGTDIPARSQECYDSWRTMPKPGKSLLHFVIRGTLPTIPHSTGGDHMSLQFVRCWCLGDKYCVPAFQDLIMVELLKYCESKAPSLGTITDAFDNAPPSSKLRILVAECAVESFHDRRWV